MAFTHACFAKYMMQCYASAIQVILEMIATPSKSLQQRILRI